MNAKDKQAIDNFLKRTEPKAKRTKTARSSKAEMGYLNKKVLRELIIDTIILGVVVIAVVCALAFLIGRLNGANCN